MTGTTVADSVLNIYCIYIWLSTAKAAKLEIRLVCPEISYDIQIPDKI